MKLESRNKRPSRSSEKIDVKKIVKKKIRIKDYSSNTFLKNPTGSE